MRQVVYQCLSMSQLEKNFDEIMSSGYSVSFFTRWADRQVDQVWIKNVIEADEEKFELKLDFFGAKVQKANLFPIEDFSAVSATGLELQVREESRKLFKKLTKGSLLMTDTLSYEVTTLSFISTGSGF